MWLSFSTLLPDWATVYSKEPALPEGIAGALDAQGIVGKGKSGSA